MRLLVLLFLALLAPTSWAQWGITTVPSAVLSAPGAVVARPGTSADFARLLAGREYIPLSADEIAGRARFRDLLARPIGPGTAAKEGAFRAVRTVPWTNIAKGIARGGPAISAILLFAEMLDDLECREKFGGGWECDQGSDKVTQNWYVAADLPPPYNGRRHPSVAAARALIYERLVLSFSAEVYHPAACTFVGTSDASVAWGAGAIYVNHQCELMYKTCPPTGACGHGSFAQNVVIQTGLESRCPDGTTDGKPVLLNKCADGVYEPATESDVENRVRDYGPKARANDIVRELSKRGVPVDGDAPESITTPGPTHVGRDTTVRPDGSTVTRDRSIEWTPGTVEGEPGYRWREVTRETVYPPGIDPPPPGEDPGEDGDTTETGTSPTEFNTCGLPTTPPCKIDETGTPTDHGLGEPLTWVNDAWAAVRACLTGGCWPELPDISWVFALPTGCAPISLGGGFAKIGWESIDICPLQPYFHAVFTMFWAWVGLIGALRIFEEA